MSISKKEIPDEEIDEILGIMKSTLNSEVIGNKDRFALFSAVLPIMVSASLQQNINHQFYELLESVRSDDPKWQDEMSELASRISALSAFLKKTGDMNLEAIARAIEAEKIDE